MAQLDRRSALRLFASLGAAGAAAPLLSACNGSRSRSEPDTDSTAIKGNVRIGALLPRSGPYKSIGEDADSGFRLYLKLAHGRLGGYTVEIVNADEGQTAESAKTAVDKLIKQDRVLALTGVMSSVSMVAIRDSVESAQVPLVGSNASPTTLQGARYIWRTSYMDDEPGKALGELVADKVGTGTCCIIAANYQAGKDEIEGFKSTFLAAGGKIAGLPLLTDFSPKPTENYLPFLNTIRASGAQAAFCFFAGEAAAQFVLQWTQAGLRLPVYAPGFLTEGTALLKTQGAAAKGINTAMNYATELDNLANHRFIAEYQKAYAALPTTYAMAAYDAAAVLDKALRQLDGTPSPQAVNAAIGKVGQIDSPRGAWRFNANRTPLQKWYLRQVTQDGPVLANSIVSELATLG